ncbi:HD domain-containing protein [Paludibacterium sp. THUN1379]|uniref:HD domain-containing phosphohydrolase n=1 Tax=Paludibacterium sp. THUN1379 TaxID=3112107 RepID=UPI00308DD47B|nr:HD domain-containing protein [Paludibacterium sp. THUN1379]
MAESHPPADHPFIDGSSVRVLLCLLIAGLVLLTAIPLMLFYYQQLQQQQLIAQNRLFRQSVHAVSQEVSQAGSRAETAVALLASLPTPAPAQAAQQIGLFIASLQNNPDLQAVFCGQEDGAFLLVRRLDGAIRQRFAHAPPGTRWLLQQIPPHAAGPARQQFQFMNHEGRALAAPFYVIRSYHPAQRPWFQMAQTATGVVHTGLYRFATTEELGITHARRSHDGKVIYGVDTQLSRLHSLLLQQRPSPHARLILLDAQRNLLVGTTQDARLADAALQAWQQQSPQSLSATWQAENESWRVALSQVASQGAAPLQLLMLVPEHEVFAEGVAISRDAVRIPLLLLLVLLPLGWLLANWISRPIQHLVETTLRIQAMDFDTPPLQRTPVREMNALMTATESMKITIRDFIGLSRQIVAETETGQLMQMLLQTTRQAMDAERAAIWLRQDDQLVPSCGQTQQAETLAIGTLPVDDALLAALSGTGGEAAMLSVRTAWLPQGMQALCPGQTARLTVFVLRLENQAMNGLLVLADPAQGPIAPNWGRLNYLKALVSFAAIALHNRQLANSLQTLMNALVELIASAIDTKSPYTGGHCKRVPHIAQALAEAAEQCRHGSLADFSMREEDRQALFFASWLHDCGKVTTPEYIVDKATKLETLYNRIHEIRMRFEVLKRDADIRYWQGLCAGGDPHLLQQQRTEAHSQLDADFAFVAHCNIGSEAMSDADLARLQQIAERRWQRTLSDRLGLGHLESQHVAQTAAASLPVEEKLLDDKAIHRYPWPADSRQEDLRWGFTLQRPAWRANLGEYYNLSIRRGTLNEEERYKINEHIMETIKMLGTLPLPAHLQQVPEIAGGHHERIDGKGYPRGLKGAQMSVLARVMAIADVFEALTASDRPYKEAKPMSEVLKIMVQMACGGHLDVALLRVFLQDDIWRSYAEQFMAAGLQDVVSAAPYLAMLPDN